MYLKIFLATDAQLRLQELVSLENMQDQPVHNIRGSTNTQNKLKQTREA